MDYRNVYLNEFLENTSLVEMMSQKQCITEKEKPLNETSFFYRETLHVPETCRLSDFSEADLIELYASFKYKVNIGGITFENVRTIPRGLIKHHTVTVVFKSCDVGKAFVAKKTYLSGQNKMHLLNCKVLCGSGIICRNGLGGKWAPLLNLNGQVAAYDSGYIPKHDFKGKLVSVL
jgi:hypothetical protein